MSVLLVPHMDYLLR